MKRLIDFSLDNRVVVISVWGLIAVFGVYSMLRLPIDAVPDVTNVQVQILTTAAGLAPQEVESFVTFPVEMAMSGVPNVEEVRSVSKFGLSVVTVVFHEGTDIYWARQLIGERLIEAREAIPEAYGAPEMGPISTGLGEIYQFEVVGAHHSPMELRSILDWHIAPQLRTVPGVVEVNSFGGELKTYQVTLDPERMLAYNVTVADVVNALEANNRNVGGGYIAYGGEQYLVRGEAVLTALEDIERVIVAYDPDNATPIYVRDVAAAEFAPMLRQGAVTRDGRGEAVVGIVMMLMGENSRTVAAAVHDRVQSLKASLPEGVEIRTFYDRTELVNRTIRTVLINLTEGGALVIAVLLLLLGSLRAGLLVALAIPMSMLVGFTAMRLTGISGNLMSLGAIDFGLIVDGSVVLIENVVRHLHDRPAGGFSRIERIRRACHEVTRPVVFAVGIIIIVYVPVLALTGIEGKMFRPMALTVVFALAGSLACALTLMPALATVFLGSVRDKEPLLQRFARTVYRPALETALRRPRLTFFAATVVFATSIALVPGLGAEFLPELDEGAIAMQIWRLPSVSLEKSNEISTRVEKTLVETFPEIDSVVSRTGRAEIATDPMGVEISDSYILLKPRDTWRFADKDALIAAIDRTLHENVPGAIFSYSQPIELRVEELISGVRSDVAIKIFGDDLELLEQKAALAARILASLKGAEDVKAEQIAGLPTIRIRINREAAATYGVNARDVLDVVESIGGKTVGSIIDGDKRFTLQVRFDESVRSNLQSFRDLRVPASQGTPGRVVPLSQIAEVRVEDGPAQISREHASRRITVEANVRGRDLAGFVADAKAALDRELVLPDGWYLQWGGEFENLEAAVDRLFVLVPIALALVFVLLYSTFHSARLAALIYLNVPMALTGGILALALRGYPFSISAAVGFIALFGVAVLNGVVLVSHIVERQRTGLSVEEAVRQGSLMRLRPVLMTALVASLGFVPMALSQNAGAEVQRPLATVVIGGIITSTLLTLLVLPAVYRWFSGGARRVDRLPM